MKRQLKKLTLSRETLHSLEESALGAALGGSEYGTLRECTIQYCSAQCFVDPKSVRCN
jgi:hypothetical protein